MSKAKPKQTDFSASRDSLRAAAEDARARAVAATDPVEGSIWGRQVRHLEALAGLHDELDRRSQAQDDGTPEVDATPSKE